MTRHVASSSAALAAWLLVTSATPLAAQTTRPQTSRAPRDHGIELIDSTAFLAPLMAIHHAHLVMLVDRGIVAPAEGHRLRLALEAIPLDAVACAPYDGSCEDLFFYVDRLLVNGCGADAAGRLHTARSRNDIDMTMYRMQQREMLLTLLERTVGLREALIAQADAHLDTVFAAHTHTQPAQPTTIAHYLHAVVEQLERDCVRLRAAYASTNRNPLGACAITGTGFPIDRGRTSDFIMNAASFGPSVTVSLMFSTTSVGW